VKRVHVARTKHAEVAVIKCRELWFVQAFDDGENRGVHEPDVRIGVPIAQLGDPSIVGGGHVDHFVCAVVDVGQQGHQHAGVQRPLDQVVDFDQDRTRDQERLVRLFNQSAATLVIIVATVERRIQRTGVEDQRQGRGSGRSSVDRRAVSLSPDDPTPRLRGRGRDAASFSSMASRTMVAIDTPRSAATRRSRARRSAGMVKVVRSMLQ
jgi:hypothetical protein